MRCIPTVRRRHRHVSPAPSRRLGAWIVTVTLLAPLGACGSGGTSDLTRRRLDIPSIASLDGTVRSDGEVTAQGGEPKVGDLASNQEVRMLLSFSLEDVPAGAEITSALLRLRTTRVTGEPLLMDPLLIERVDIGTALDGTDFSSLALSSATNVTMNGLLVTREIEVTTLVQQDVNELRTRTDLRLRLFGGTDGDLRDDWFGFETGDNEYRTGERAELSVTYETTP
ncbi:MAG: hypothetical protein H6806_03940 [Planctomycetes bacterium]|nr:hypothetical protein [Planctomycetota bacterium]MCB9825017.1 hypothetical protein [Planctomycetota bacterium]MCB9828905.1 hypothetical protein [Planctomycetota bacterium]MCB9902036.1 hypothetical protein [Planctomycetota bacterium]